MVAMPEQPINPLTFATGPMMMLVALAFVVAWKRRTHVKLRWFWAGAGVWTLGVALKIACALRSTKNSSTCSKKSCPTRSTWRWPAPISAC